MVAEELHAGRCLYGPEIRAGQEINNAKQASLPVILKEAKAGLIVWG